MFSENTNIRGIYTLSNELKNVSDNNFEIKQNYMKKLSFLWKHYINICDQLLLWKIRQYGVGFAKTLYTHACM